MNKGKTDERKYRLSVLKVLGKQNNINMYEPAFSVGEGVVSGASIMTGNEEGLCELCIYRACNVLLLRGAVPKELSLMIAYNSDISNDKLKSITLEAVKAAEVTGTVIKVFETTVSSNPEVTVACTAFGTASEEPVYRETKDIENPVIIMYGSTAVSGTSLLAKRYRNSLLKRLPESFLGRAIKDNKEFFLNSDNENTKKLLKSGLCIKPYPITDGGVFGALWELCEREKCGCEIKAKAIPIEQPVVEVCELLSVSPYQMRGDGAFLTVVSEEAAADMSARIIGKITKNNDRIILVGEEKRFLEPNRTDTYYCIDSEFDKDFQKEE